MCIFGSFHSRTMRVYPWLKETGTIFSRQIRGRSAPAPRRGEVPRGSCNEPKGVRYT